ARQVALDLMAAMRKRTGRVVVGGEADGHHLIAVRKTGRRVLPHFMTADTAAPRELALYLLPCSALRAEERRLIAVRLLALASGQSAAQSRALDHRARLGRHHEFSGVVVLQHLHDFTRLAMRQLTIRRGRIEGQLMTAHTVALH